MTHSAVHNVLVLDANQRASLAVVRSLGSHSELRIIAADEQPEALAGSSKYCQLYLRHPAIMDQPHEFLAWLSEAIKIHRISMLIPITEVSSQLVLMHSNRFSDCLIPYADINKIAALANKRNLIEIAQPLGVPVPTTKLLQQGQQALELDINTYPVVLKPELSRIWLEDHWLTTAVHVVHSKQELDELLARHRYLSDFPVMLQAFIPGTGAGLFTVFNNGEPIAFFTHKRLREKPPSGGVSVLSESAPLNTDLIGYSQKILQHVGWHGVAMVEYRIAEDGTPYLMEVNTRFWGSLQLAIDSGVDFPWLLYQIASEKKIDTVDSYRTGQRLRWLLGDLDRLYLVLKNSQHYSVGDKLRAVAEFLTPSWRNSRQEVFRFHDMRPAWHEFKHYLSDIRA